ncbi:MAG: GntR family transcriptional regulator [Candidatus Eisenbacteria bacterium]|nr:GntR family transcriptional regulator [Candidatus Eisenbacteria bacterium]
MKLELDSESPTPLYHQIAESLRYRIGTGALEPGSTLPPVRTAAADWGVNFHTVRRAYRVLADDGLVEIDGPRGTRVTASPAKLRAHSPSPALAAFLGRTLREAVEEFSLTVDQLTQHLRAFRGTTRTSQASVSILECSEAQCQAHAAEVESRWDVRAETFCLSRSDEPPEGDLIATYFHFNEIRRRWPHRLNDLQFVAIHPDPALSERLGRALAEGLLEHRDEPRRSEKRRRHEGRGRESRRKSGSARRVVLCEFDAGQAQSVATDLHPLLASTGVEIETRVVERANELLPASDPGTHLVFTPRAWAKLTAEEQALPEAHPLVYVIRSQDMEELGSRFGWHERVHRLVSA